MDSLYSKILEIVGEGNVFEYEDMKKHTTFKAGGTARYFVTPEDEHMLSKLIVLLEGRYNYYIVGNGSNLLVKDEGYDGVIIKIGQKMSYCMADECEIICGAGAYLSKAANIALENSLTGLEFAGGIPGFMGGAIAMNAGAYGGEMKDIVKEVTMLDKEGKIFTLKCDEMDFGYRKSIVQEKEYIVISTVLKLKKGNKEEIAAKMKEFMTARKDKQPLEFPSAGSTFKRPEGYFAGKLIMDAGLRGYCVGDACVSEKHCGFVVNKGNATATDIIKLIEEVTEIVKDKFGVLLETEVKII